VEGICLPKKLNERIFSLRNEVNEDIRECLLRLLETLRTHGFVEQVLSTMIRLVLDFMKLLFHSADKSMPNSQNLYDCIDHAVKEIGLPEEIASYLQMTRVLGNNPSKGAEKIKLTIDDAEIVLSAFIRVIKWFYCESPNGSKLKSIYEQPQERIILSSEKIDQIYHEIVKAESLFETPENLSSACAPRTQAFSTARKN